MSSCRAFHFLWLLLGHMGDRLEGAVTRRLLGKGLWDMASVKTGAFQFYLFDLFLATIFACRLA